MKLAPPRIAAFLAKPDAATRAALVYGPDAGLVRERADRIAAAICPDLRDAFRVTDLTAAALLADPARLNDEAAALSLIGGRRVVRVRDAGDAAGALFERFLASLPPGDSIVVVEGGELPARSSLRRAFEEAASAVAIPCYADGRRELEELVRDVLGARRIAIDNDAMAYLVGHLGGDRLASRRELEKLALFAGDGGRVGLADATQSVGDSAAMTIDDIVYAAAEGDAAALERALMRAFLEGEMPVSVLRALMRHFQRLHLVQSRIAAGSGDEDALRSLRPPLFFKLQDRFKRQLRLWPQARAAQALALLTQAEINAKTTGLPAEAICRDALLRIARGAAPRAQR
ncbi:MAG TPA: DNA polymerase III subunit delta [Stellaceae bacterium]|nr:DNA polymerase III subunit delta [Stellaceae bacterium]